MELAGTTLLSVGRTSFDHPAKCTVTDAQVIHDYYLARYNAPSTMIAYGAEVERKPDRAMVRRWRVEPLRSLRFPARTENNAICW